MGTRTPSSAVAHSRPHVYARASNPTGAACAHSTRADAVSSSGVAPASPAVPAVAAALVGRCTDAFGGEISTTRGGLSGLAPSTLPSPFVSPLAGGGARGGGGGDLVGAAVGGEQGLATTRTPPGWARQFADPARSQAIASIINGQHGGRER